MPWKFFLDETEFGTVEEAVRRNDREPQPQNNVMAWVPTGHGECRLLLSIPDLDMRFQLSDKVGQTVKWELRADSPPSSLGGNGTLQGYNPQEGTALISW